MNKKTIARTKLEAGFKYILRSGQWVEDEYFYSKAEAKYASYKKLPVLSVYGRIEDYLQGDE